MRTAKQERAAAARHQRQADEHMATKRAETTQTSPTTQAITQKGVGSLIKAREHQRQADEHNTNARAMEAKKATDILRAAGHKNDENGNRGWWRDKRANAIRIKTRERLTAETAARIKAINPDRIEISDHEWVTQRNRVWAASVIRIR